MLSLIIDECVTELEENIDLENAFPEKVKKIEKLVRLLRVYLRFIDDKNPSLLEMSLENFWKECSKLGLLTKYDYEIFELSKHNLSPSDYKNTP